MRPVYPSYARQREKTAAAAERTHSGAVCDDLSMGGKVTGKRKDQPCGAGMAGNNGGKQRNKNAQLSG